MLHRVAWTVSSLLLLTLPASAGRPAPERLLQAPSSQSGWILALDQRRARLEAANGDRRTFRVRRGEQLLDFVEFEDGWLAAGIRPRDASLDLSLVLDLGRGPKRLGEPEGRQGALRTGPAALAGPGGLAGLAWLEGDGLTRMAVRAAPYEDGNFGSATTVSAPGPGSQSGLTGAVLADGTWLLVWSRFDGDDDEIYWASRSPGGSWTSPRRLAPGNAVPDVTPRVFAQGEGAIVAWSRLAEEYEVVTAHFSNHRWTAPRRLGARGSISPTFRRLRDRDYLLVRNAWPAGWTAFRLDASGRPVDFVTFGETSAHPPALRPAGGSAVAFEWPGRDAVVPSNWEPLR